MAAHKGKKRYEQNGVFRCDSCGFTSPLYSFSTICPFDSGLQFLEKTYVGRDPFSDKFRPLILGSPCALCNKPVCVNQECSLFYVRRYCKECFEQHRAYFPVELQKSVK